MQPSLLIAIAAGGAVGAVGRYLVVSAVGHWMGQGFPWGTLAVNVLGSLVMGILVEVMALVWSPSPELRALLVVGVLGAFTTFSTFSLDVVFLIDRGEFLSALAYILASVVVCVAGLYAGIHGIRAILA
ncbi:MAG: fluoride efflux transporter CrcB [Pseudomonadota bacterium]